MYCKNCSEEEFIHHFIVAPFSDILNGKNAFWACVHHMVNREVAVTVWLFHCPVLGLGYRSYPLSPMFPV